MPGGKGNITHADSVPFTSENQPKNRRKSTKFLTELLTKELEGKKEIIIEGIDPVTGKPAKIKVPMPTKSMIIQALLRKASKGDMVAIKEVFDRTEGKAPQNIDVTTDGEKLNTDVLSPEEKKLLYTLLLKSNEL